MIKAWFKRDAKVENLQVRTSLTKGRDKNTHKNWPQCTSKKTHRNENSLNSQQ